MYKWTLLLWLVALATPSFAARSVTVAELNRVLASAQGTPDVEFARQLAELELTERLSTVNYTRRMTQAPGPKSRQALTTLADLSAFLDLPPAEVSAAPAPDLPAQRRMMALTVDYVTKTIHQLPNLSTTRVTDGFQDKPWQRTSLQQELTGHQPFHQVGTYSATVLYRNGQEVVQTAGAAPQGLTTSGEFGPILGTVMLDAARSKLAWSHWEQGESGALAVYRYAVPADKSHYEVKYCCILRDTGDRIYFQQFSGYRGEIAVDPATGAILRLTLRADLKPSDPLVKADILVEYGSVEIAGKTYICPVRSVALSVGLDLQPSARQGAEDTLRPLQTSLNDVVFAQYHVFRAEARMLAPDGAAQAPRAMSVASPGNADANPPSAEQPTASMPEVPPTEKVAAAVVAPPAVTEAPESSVSVATGLPDTPLIAPTPQQQAMTLRVTTRLVDVGLTVLDKKGRAVTDLKPEEIELYDNGRKQVVQLIRPTMADDDFKKPEHASGSAPDQPVFSNRRAALSAGTPENAGGVITILLVDAGNLAWADLNHAREEMLRFLRTQTGDERVGFYTMQAHGFEVLEEGTSDHELLASKLRQWMPSAQALSSSQEMEQRNRQQFDEVRSPSDLQYVNGNMNSAPETASPIDPNLRDDGSHPGRDSMALPVLVGVARHLGSIPGHKNLVWVTGDNALVDWTDKALGSDKGSKHIDGPLLRTQEALNDAHVSVYPLDASQLETMAVDAGLKNQAIQLEPGVLAAPAPQGGAEKTGRVAAEMQQDIRSIERPIQEMAEATGGRVFRRAGDLAGELNGVVADGRAAYLLSFTPDIPADDQYHHLSVKLSNRRGLTLRYRTGYQYAAQPSTLKERFRQAIWQPLDVNEIAVSGSSIKTSGASKLMLNIATDDLAMREQQERWRDSLAIFLVARDEGGLHAKITGQTLQLALKAATYQGLVGKSIPFQQLVEQRQSAQSLRLIVVDENSGRMGSITLPPNAWEKKP